MSSNRSNVNVIEGLLDRFKTGEYFYKDRRVYRTLRNINGDVSATLDKPEIASKAGISGYRRVFYKKDSLYEHRLIFAYHFGVEELLNYECIDHIDGDKENNKIENLRGLSIKENTHHAEAQGNFRRTFGGINGRTVVSDEVIVEIRRLGGEGINQYDIADLFNVSQGYVSNVINYKVRARCGRQGAEAEILNEGKR